MLRITRVCFAAVLCSLAGAVAAAQQSAGGAGSSYTVVVPPKGSGKGLQQKTGRPGSPSGMSVQPAGNLPAPPAGFPARAVQASGNLPRPSQLPAAGRQPLPGPENSTTMQQPAFLRGAAPQPSAPYGVPAGSYRAMQPLQPAAARAGYGATSAPAGAAVGLGSSVTVMVMPKGYKGKAAKVQPMTPMPGAELTGPQSMPVAKALGGRPAAVPAYAVRGGGSDVRGAMVAPPAAYGAPVGAGDAAPSGFAAVPSYANVPPSNAPLPKLDTRPMVLAKKPVPKKVAPVVRATRTRELPEGYEPNPPDEAMLKRERLRWDGEYELDRLERPQLDSAGKVIPVLYERNGKAVRPKGVRLGKLHPATIQNGVLTVDGWTSKGRLNYAVQDLKFLYFSVPGVGTVVVSPESFGGAEEQADAFNGNTLKVTAGDHEVQLVTEKPILTKNSLPAYVKVDKDYVHDRKAPVIGYGGFENAPYLWPGAVAGQAMQGSLDAPELPKNMMPAMAGHLCDSRTGDNCEPVPGTAAGTERPAWAVDPNAPADAAASGAGMPAAGDGGRPAAPAAAAAPVDPTKPAVAPSRIVEEPLSAR